MNLSFTEKEFYPTQVVKAELQGQRATFRTENSVALNVYILSAHIIRFRYSTDGYFHPDFSYGPDPSYQPISCKVTLIEEESHYELRTEEITCLFSKTNLGVTIQDKNGHIICQDEKGFHWEKNEEYGGDIVKMSKVCQPSEAFYGLGDKPTDLNIKNKRFVNWGTDNYGYNKNSDPLYKNIPVYYGLHEGIGFGIFFDNSFKSFFDFGSERNNAISFWAEGGEMNYYFIGGPSLLDACKRYTRLTGTPDMPPLWSLGFQQCKWSYYPESQVREIADTMRKWEIPCDAIYLDIDYMDGFRCFTWDKEKFPDPKGLVKDLKNQGFKTMVIIDPGIKIDKDYWVFKEGLEKGYFCRRPDGPFVNGKVWPGECYFPDFTNPDVREWWAGLYKELVEEIGVAGVWNDMNEPALFEVESKTFPLDVLHDHDGHLCSHRKAHNVYGMMMARATAEGVKQFAGGKRSLIITRSGYAGMQRYSSVWTGDNIASVEHLWLASTQAQRLSISGVSFCGSDIGGFINQPNGELFVRWIQLGIFHPFCRVHSSGDHGDQEPWSFGEKYTVLFKEAVELRYRLLPYIYTAFYQYHKEGDPMLKPLVFFDQKDTNNINKDHEFICGNDILVAPVLNKTGQRRNLYLPEGTWYSYWDNEVYQGAENYAPLYDLKTFPLFVQAGTVLPLYPVMQYVDEKIIDEVTLNVYYKNGEYSSYYYEDDHEGYGYENNDFRLAHFKLKGAGDYLELNQEIEGTFQVNLKTYRLRFIGHPEALNRLEIDGHLVELNDNVAIVSSAFKHLKLS